MPEGLKSVRLYSLEEASKYLGKDRRTISRYVEAGELRATRMGNRVRFTKEDLEAFAQKGTSPKYWSTIQKKKDDRLDKVLIGVDEGVAGIRKTVNAIPIAPALRQRLLTAVSQTEKAVAALKKALDE